MKKENIWVIIVVSMIWVLSGCASKEDDIQEIPFQFVEESQEATTINEESSSVAKEHMTEVTRTETETLLETQTPESQKEMPDLTGNTESEHTSSVDLPQETASDIYVGEYNDYDMNEPNLEIQKNEDGTYWIQIGIFRLVFLDDGIGKLVENKIEFQVTAPNGKTIDGTITVEEDVATVTFTSQEWSTYSSVNVYQYYKVSTVPNMYGGLEL